MCVCDCVMIGGVKHRERYVTKGVIERRKYTEVYNFVGITILRLGLYVVVLLGVSIGC